MSYVSGAERLLYASLIDLLLFVGGCINPADGRAELDQEVGRGKAGGLEIVVEGGLAVIHRLEPGIIELWAGAPSLKLHLKRDPNATAVWTIKVRNCMPNGQLQLATSSRNGDAAPTVLWSKRWSATTISWGALLVQGDQIATIAPPPIKEPYWRFAVISDFHVGRNDEHRIGRLFRGINKNSTIHFILSTGDMSTEGRRDELYLFQDLLEQLDVPYFTTIGNHEASGTNSGYWHETFGRHSFHFEFGGISFSLLDSGNASISPLAYEMLDKWLDASKQKIHIFASHVPTFDPVGVRNGSFRSRKEAAKLHAKLARGKVDLILNGHLHSYYAFDNAQIPTFISGGGAPKPERLVGIGAHYLTVDVSPTKGVLQVAIVHLQEEE